MRPLSGLSLGVGAALVVATVVVRPGSSVGTAIYFAAGAAAVVAVFHGPLGARRPGGLLWILARAAILAFVAAGAVQAALRGTVLPDGSLVSLVSLPGYLLVAALVLALARAAGRGEAAVTDAALGTLTLLSLLWPAAIEPHVVVLPDASAAVALLFTVADLVLLALLMGAALSSLAELASFRLLAAALAALFASDLVAQSPALAGPAEAHAVAACYVAAYAFAVAAALHPSALRFASPLPQRQAPASRTVGLVTLALLSLPGGIGFDRLLDSDADPLFYTTAGAAVVVLVAVRVGRVVARSERLRLQAQAAEQRFRMVFESAGIGISIGADGMMSETNPALQRMLGYGGEELAALHYRDVTHPEDAESDAAVDLQVMTGRLPRHSFEKRYVRKDGTVFPAEVTLTRATDGTFGISLIEDISARRDLEEELRQAQKLEAVGKLAGGIAHDFNNLLTVVGGYADVLERGFAEGDPRRPAVEAITQAAGRAADLTRQLLAFSRRQVLRPEPTELNEVVAGLETLLRRLLPENVVLVLDAAPGATAQVDRAQLEQVVLNLVLNARDAMPDGGTLTVATRAAAGAAELCVADDGVGMDEVTRRRCFEPFYSTKPIGAGTGLGLSTVEGIVAQSGGAIALASEPGRGTVLTVRLPLVAAAPAVAPEPRPARSAPRTGTVLLAEDEELVRTVTASMLERGGYDVVATASGEEALRRLDDGLVPDILVTDVVMTGIGGPGLAELARAHVPGLPVLFVSGYPDSALDGEGALEGADLLVKPFRGDELLQAVARADRRRALSAAS